MRRRTGGQRSDITTLLDAVTFDDANSTHTSSAVNTAYYRRFTLYLELASTNSPTDLQLWVEFSPDSGANWYRMQQGEFASMVWDDVVIAASEQYCFHGVCAGSDFRVRMVANGVDATNTFTATVKVGFWS